MGHADQLFADDDTALGERFQLVWATACHHMDMTVLARPRDDVELVVARDPTRTGHVTRRDPTVVRPARIALAQVAAFDVWVQRYAFR